MVRWIQFKEKWIDPITCLDCEYKFMPKIYWNGLLPWDRCYDCPTNCFSKMLNIPPGT